MKTDGIHTFCCFKWMKILFILNIIKVLVFATGERHIFIFDFTNINSTCVSLYNKNDSVVLYAHDRNFFSSPIPGMYGSN